MLFDTPLSKKIILVSWALVTTALTPKLYAATDSDISVIQDIKEAYESKNVIEFERLSALISDSSLFSPSIDAWRFRLTFDNPSESERTDWPTAPIQKLLEQHDNTWEAELLRRQWLEQLAQKRQVNLYKTERKKLRYRPDQGVICADMMVNAINGQYVAERAHAIVTEPSRLPQTCRDFIRYLFKKNVLKTLDLDLRVLHLVGVNHLTNSIKFIEENAETNWAKDIDISLFRQAVFKPERFIKKASGKSQSLIVTASLTRLAVSDYDYAANLLKGKYRKAVNKSHARWLWGFIGYRAALNWDSNSVNYFAKADPKLLSQEIQEWQLRAHLLTNQWSSLEKLIGKLPVDLKEESRWRYWQARSLSELGKIEEARRIWASIANPFDFYGKLSTEELGATVQPPKQSTYLTAEELAEANNNLGLQRALAYYDAGLRTEGFREFNLQTEQMNDRQLLAAATWALKNELYDRAIAAADRTQALHDISLRYPTPFRLNLVNSAKETGIEDAWVYGVIRQESRFITIARSHAGANGLMQVMPATAKYVARKIGLKGFRLSSVNELDTNLTLGTNYLRMTLEDLDYSMVLASAGYNAGPSRPKTWRNRLPKGKAIEGAIFAELIPFNETRHYVQNVLSNTMAYSLVLHGNTPSLKERLGIIWNTN